MTTKKAEGDEMRMSSSEFDRIMGQALRVKPEDSKKAKKSARRRVRKKKKT